MEDSEKKTKDGKKLRDILIESNIAVIPKNIFYDALKEVVKLNKDEFCYLSANNELKKEVDDLFDSVPSLNILVINDDGDYRIRGNRRRKMREYQPTEELKIVMMAKRLDNYIMMNHKSSA